MEKVVGVCGCICSDCTSFNSQCEGCHSIKGMASWLDEVDLNVCDFDKCSVTDKNLKHCGECTDIPCNKFWDNKSPKLSEEEHKIIVEERVTLLKLQKES